MTSDLMKQLSDELAEFAGEDEAVVAQPDPARGPSPQQLLEMKQVEASLLAMPDMDQISGMKEAVNAYIDLEKKIAQLNAALERMTSAKNHISSRMLPAMFAESGVTKFETEEAKLELKPFVSAKLPEDPGPAFSWLEEHGHGTLIKNNVNLAFDRTDAEKAAVAMGILKEAGFGGVMTNKQSIHNATLVSFLKKELEKGEVIPLELFGAYQGNSVKIKLLPKALEKPF